VYKKTPLVPRLTYISTILVCKCEWYFFIMLQSWVFSLSLLKSVSWYLNASTLWMSLCSLVQQITEELSLSLALPLEIFQACETPGEPQRQDALTYEKYRESNQKLCTLEELPDWGWDQGYGYNTTCKTCILFSLTKADFPRTMF